MQTLKSLVLVFTTPIIVSVCFFSGIIPMKVKRAPAIEVVKEYHFNRSLLSHYKK